MSAHNRPGRHSTSRRSFLKNAVATGVTLAAGPYIVRGRTQETQEAETQPTTQPKYKDVRVAFVGTGGIGGYHFDHAAKELGVSCPCYCDVDTDRYGKFAERFPEARAYQDYRKMFDREHKNIDAVMIGTPDHHHFPATIIAMQLGKHVYTQKPLTHTPWEARQLALAAQKYRVATQMGNQGRSMEGWRLIYEWVHSGALGDIKETHTWTNRPVWPQGGDRPEEPDDVPDSLDWDCWLGPAPERPYKAKAYHPFVWRGWWDFGAGALGDMACHTMDAIFGTFAPGYPTAIEVLACTPVHKEEAQEPTVREMFPKASIVKWHWPANGKRPAFASYWYDGELMPQTPACLEPDRKMPETGNLFIGTKGTMLIRGDYCEHPRFIPETKMREVGKPPQILERSPGHVEEWLMACAGEKPVDFPKSNFAYAGPFTEAILLGNIALRFGRKLLYDGQKAEFTNLPAANQHISKEYRRGWTPEELGWKG
ncbi:MAG: Gfo/Idh/MocA family oxidoreductase [Planctomycetota bacterium]